MKRHALPLAASLAFCGAAQAQQAVEELHWWTSGGEAANTAVRARDGRQPADCASATAKATAT